jgi:hypothetical protein
LLPKPLKEKMDFSEAKIGLNSSGISKTASKPWSNLVKFMRFLVPKRPFLTPNVPFLTPKEHPAALGSAFENRQNLTETLVRFGQISSILCTKATLFDPKSPQIDPKRHPRRTRQTLLP